MVNEMTSWERLEACARLEEVDFVQSYIGLRGPSYREAPAVDALKRWPEAVHFSSLPGQPNAADFGAKLDDRTRHADSDWWEPIIKDAEDYDKIKVPEIRASRASWVEEWYEKHRGEFPKDVRDRFGLLKACSVYGPIDFASELRGYDNLLADFLRNPEGVHRLLNAITAANVEWMELCMEVQDEVGVLVLADHSPTMLSPRLFKAFGEPYWRREIGAAPKDAIIWYHNEGNATHNLENLADLGINVFHYGWIDEAEAKRRIGDRVCLCGNLKSTSTLLRGSVEDVVKATERLISIVAPGGGCILSSSGGMAPNTPLENVDAMYNTGLRYGRYTH